MQHWTVSFSSLKEECRKLYCFELIVWCHNCWKPFQITVQKYGHWKWYIITIMSQNVIIYVLVWSPHCTLFVAGSVRMSAFAKWSSQSVFPLYIWQILFSLRVKKSDTEERSTKHCDAARLRSWLLNYSVGLQGRLGEGTRMCQETVAEFWQQAHCLQGWFYEEG